jgi:hypothetical protein
MQRLLPPQSNRIIGSSQASIFYLFIASQVLSFSSIHGIHGGKLQKKFGDIGIVGIAIKGEYCRGLTTLSAVFSEGVPCPAE